MNKQLTVFIGRFSIFHLGHEEVLKRALSSSEVVLLLIGSAHQSRNIKNPFTYEERKSVFENWHKRMPKSWGKLVIRPIQDQPYNDDAWIQSVQQEVINVKTECNIADSVVPILTGAQRDASSWYLKAFGSFFGLDLLNEGRIGFDLNATQIRKDYFEDGHLWEYKTPDAMIDFLDYFQRTATYQELVAEAKFVTEYKASWASAPFPPTFVTVDTCVVQSGHVLVVTRDNFPGKGLLALPGGFVEQNETLLNAALRELVEETRIELAPAQLRGSVKAQQTFDNPDRSTRGRTITTCFLLKLDDSKPLPKVTPQKGEVRKLQWMPLAVAVTNPDKWYEDHHAMLVTMLANIPKK